MCKAIMKKNEYGKLMISCDILLDGEPVALYVNRDSHEFSLSFCNGNVISLGHPAKCPELLAMLFSMREVTIESQCAGLLAAGYRVGVRQRQSTRA